MSLRLVSNIETIINETITANELPPPLPVEARMSWLSNIAIPKSELPKTERKAVIETPKPTRNAWEGLPELPRQNVGRELARSHNPNARFIYAKFDSVCHGCESYIERGDRILWFKLTKRVYCSDCEVFQENDHGIN